MIKTTLRRFAPGVALAALILRQLHQHSPTSH